MAVLILKILLHDFNKLRNGFNEYYSGVDPFNFYEKIKGRVKCLQRHLTSIKADESQLIQVRLIFEIQVAFIVNCQDFLIDRL
ncbi:hypothetical protein MSIBF_A3170004 [groundwater metagenome]|uniref:Uncharacterized protein n=1 Tax=groundwater metagenome TaxID=717931 RepID=A0A098EDG0_9ZZZZ